MTHEELVYRLTLELYDLKAKLEIIRNSAERISAYCSDKSDFRAIKLQSIDIINEIDSGEIYD